MEREVYIIDARDGKGPARVHIKPGKGGKPGTVVKVERPLAKPSK